MLLEVIGGGASSLRSGGPLTWPGMKSLRIMGSPLISASAMVPGPALVMMQSQAPIHFSIWVSNPRICRRITVKDSNSQPLDSEP